MQGRAVQVLCSSSTSGARFLAPVSRRGGAGANTKTAVCKARRSGRRDGGGNKVSPRADSTAEGHVHSACTESPPRLFVGDESAAAHDDLAQDILGPSSSFSPSRRTNGGAESVSFKLKDNGHDDGDDSRDMQRSSHPDAIKRRLKAERRRKRRNMMSAALSKDSAWWKIECTANMVVVATSDEFYYELRTARQQKRDIVVQYFSPHCFACKEEALHCAQIASHNPDTMFIRVHYDRCKAVSDVHNISKLPWVQYYKHEEEAKDSASASSSFASSPCHEGVRLSTFKHLLQIPAGLLESGTSSYCVMSPSLKEIENFDTLLQAIYL